MKSIKFSHRYIKMPRRLQNGSTVQLIEVFKSKFEELSNTFINYDTEYQDDGCYALPKKGDCLVLLFLGDGLEWDSGKLFTTVRRSTPDKNRYYRGLRGQRLIVEMPK